MTEKTLPEQACVYQRSGDGLKVQGDSKSIDLIRTALRSHEEVLPELCNRLAQATNAISRLTRENERLARERNEYRRMFTEKADEKAYWAREFYKLRAHCERVKGHKMTEKTLPEQARFLAKFIEEKEYDEWPWADYEIAQMLEDLATEIESESKAADEMQASAITGITQYQRMCEYAERLRAERDELLKMARPFKWIAAKYEDMSDDEIISVHWSNVRELAELVADMDGRNDDR